MNWWPDESGGKSDSTRYKQLHLPSSERQLTAPPLHLHPHFSMPKKHHKSNFAKPANTVHPSLLSSSSRHNQNGGSRASEQQPSVNDLINHLRRTQVSTPSAEDRNASPSRFVPAPAPRTVHPSLRNLLEVPETPPPRPRPNAPRIGIGARRLRRVAGPPPPESWLLGTGGPGGSSSDTARDDDLAAITAADERRRVIYRLERLPGAVFPRRDGLLHMVLKSMALNWAWHVEYDGVFLATLPGQVKVLLLSYIAVYARDLHLKGLMQGLRPLFLKGSDEENNDHDGYDEGNDGDYYSGRETDTEISRLDLGGALGRWLTFKQLTSELVASRKPETQPVQLKPEDTIPTSWDEEAEDGEDNFKAPSSSPLPKSLNPTTLRFENLRFLSLAHPNPASANWNSLVTLLSRLSTITHLSLAHWPVPTLTPNAINASIRHPVHRSLTFAYGGTDSYAAMENNWAEAAVVLRKLARLTYCLKWLDLEGCGDWIRALCWEDVGPDGEAYGSTGAVWNGSWRDIEWIGLGPGWIPPGIDDVEPDGKNSLGNLSSSRSLAASIHAPPPPQTRGDLTNAPEPETATDNLPWDVDIERIKYRRTKEVERFRALVDNAKAVQSHVLQLRREGRGKWVRFSLGLEEVPGELLERLLGVDYYLSGVGS